MICIISPYHRRVPVQIDRNIVVNKNLSKSRRSELNNPNEYDTIEKIFDHFKKLRGNTLPDINHEINRRRTFAIISHPDAGKTTLTEKLLLYGGAITLAGAVKGKKKFKARRF